ncbi:hypothetical protein LA76x_0754 [Lysobacter antibioticus]|uniref:Uncharacterized protein n=1 Tax=Lysobacter antibioticus TaxID=84531 RepID=A0A0S2F5Z0_LYSAN|nr:hypothetical protein LA76x_0754 [Lysobacter antibioticus]
MTNGPVAHAAGPFPFERGACVQRPCATMSAAMFVEMLMPPARLVEAAR